MYQNKLIENLLENVSIISKKYDDIAKITGENFNIFSVMDMEWSEVYTHSAIIGELLNPKGTHRQDDVFLNCFIEILNEKFDLNIMPFERLVDEKICERTISEVNLINGTGGRIDIILEDKKQIIIIENKPGYQDQPLQLIRYSNYAKTKGKAFKVFYLTMNGRNLTFEETYKETENNIEIKGFNFHYSEIDKHESYQTLIEDKVKIYKCLYYPISFHTEIRDWLVKCHKEAIEQPILRETIKQYLNLIKKLTNQTTNDVMSQEIEKLITIDNVNSIFELNNALNQIKEKATNKLFDTINNKLEDIVINSDEKIKVGFKSDSDGIFIGYERVLNGISTKGKEEYFNKLKEFKQDAKSTDYHFFWYYPEKTGKQVRREFLDNKLILDLYRNEIFFQNFVQEILNEELMIRNEFKRLFVK